MKAFLQKAGGEWYDDFVYISIQPLIEYGYEIVPFDGDDMENTLDNKVINSKTDICIGCVEVLNHFFTLCKKPIPKYLGYPEQLKGYLGRNISRIKFGDLKYFKFPYFIKPINQVKLFTGGVMEKESYLKDLILFDKVTDDVDLYFSPVLNFVTEYRVFVSYGKIYGLKHYQGDFTKFIDIERVNRMIKAYTNCPSAYTLDVGLGENGTTFLVEVNDMWAIGSYGLDGKTYSLLCARRLRELLK